MLSADWTKMVPQNAHEVVLTPPDSKNTWDFMSYLGTLLDYNYVIIAICHLQQMTLKTHARPYTPFLITKTPGKWIILDVLPMTEHYASIWDSFG